MQYDIYNMMTQYNDFGPLSTATFYMICLAIVDNVVWWFNMLSK